VCEKNRARFKHLESKKWQQFKQKHMKLKSFKSADHEEESFNNFNKTDAIIEESNAKFRDGLVKFELDHNWVSALSEAEKNALNGVPAPPVFVHGKRAATSGFKDVQDYAPDSRVPPASVDWTTRWTAPARDQNPCGSCWAFALCGAIEAYTFLQKGVTAMCSPQNLVDCCKSDSRNTYSVTGCSGGWYQDANRYILNSGGNPKEATYPYAAREQTCKSVQAADRFFKTTNGLSIKKGSMADLLHAVAFKGPVITCLYAGGAFSSYKTGVYSDASVVGVHCNHAVLIVGYGTLAGVPYWKIRNSWTATWGQQGHILYARNGINYGAIYDFNFFPILQ